MRLSLLQKQENAHDDSVWACAWAPGSGTLVSDAAAAGGAPLRSAAARGGAAGARLHCRRTPHVAAARAYACAADAPPSSSQRRMPHGRSCTLHLPTLPSSLLPAGDWLGG